ncbi:hypothetical protein F2P81_024492 [Scophthalmus maximus]|uniref:Uncharacterized protein n=1 Tax=Scophthalmus maximus TaxID=52904 RepID=A0A6A4RXM7_SCOMX|nr:hypothetical protein F2P81_024492 [Scophthalmus maximus]
MPFTQLESGVLRSFLGWKEENTDGAQTCFDSDSLEILPSVSDSVSLQCDGLNLLTSDSADHAGGTIRRACQCGSAFFDQPIVWQEYIKREDSCQESVSRRETIRQMWHSFNGGNLIREPPPPPLLMMGFLEPNVELVHTLLLRDVNVEPVSRRLCWRDAN